MSVIMGVMASQITGVSIGCTNVCSGANQRNNQSSASLAFVGGIHRWPVNSLHKRLVTREMFPFDCVIMKLFDRDLIAVELIFHWILTTGSFYWHVLTLIPAWIRHYIHYKIWGEITYPFPNFNGATVTYNTYASCNLHSGTHVVIATCMSECALQHHVFFHSRFICFVIMPVDLYILYIYIYRTNYLRVS